MKHSEVTDRIICAFYNVYNKLGYGFLEKVYEKALVFELGKMGVSLTSQAPIKVYYESELVGEYFADLLVENRIIVEVKACQMLKASHEAQLLNYLKATEIDVGLLLNFGPKAELRRKSFDITRKRLEKSA